MIASCYRDGDALIIVNPKRWFDARSLAISLLYGNGLGYREYSTVLIHNVCQLYEDEFMNLLGAANSAMKHPAWIGLDIRKVEDYKLFPDRDRIANLVRGKGFRNVSFSGEWLFAEK